jgi:hypothetical protein
MMQLIFPLITGRPTALFEPQYPQPPTMATPTTILKALQATNANVVAVVPSMLEVGWPLVMLLRDAHDTW